MTAASMVPDRATRVGSDDIRVAVVDDSAVVRGLVARWVDEDPQLSTVGRYANGKLAVEGILKSTPDVIVLDVEMPVMDGMEALPLLLDRRPDTRIIMASTLTRRNAEISLRALALGATDYIPKPEGNRGVTTSSDFRRELVRKIKAVGRARRTGETAARPATNAGRVTTPAPPVKLAPTIRLRTMSRLRPRILVIGSSTGGPQALTRLLSEIRGDIRGIPVLVTQHMPPTFTGILAEQLGRSIQGAAKEGENGEAIRPGTVYVAPGGMHMALNADRTLRIYDGPDINFCKPAVDPMFESAAKVYGVGTLAVVLTGMGHDGADGALKIAEAGGSVIAQDEETSVVWGMPGAAASAGACAAVLPLGEISHKINALLRRPGP